MTLNSAQVLSFPGQNNEPAIATSQDPFPSDSPMYFPVESRPVQVIGPDGQGSAAHNHQAVVRTDTDEILGIHSKTYKVVANEPLFRRFDDAIRSSDLDLEGLTVEDHVNYGGKKVVRHYRFPTMRSEPRINDIVEMRITVVNSFDCGNAFAAQVSGFRLWCLNGAVTPHGTASVYGRHTRGFDDYRALGKAAEAIERYMTSSEQWIEWTQREITPEQAQATLEAFPDVNPSMLNRLERAWATESANAGSTVWALYNAATRWSTHTPVRDSSEGNKASIVLDRERRVRQFMRSRSFKALAA